MWRLYANWLISRVSKGLSTLYQYRVLSLISFLILAGCASSGHPPQNQHSHSGALSLQKPVSGLINSPFSLVVDQSKGHKRVHYGVDIPAPKYTPIKAAESGRVVVASTWRGYGKIVIIDHGDGWRTRYAHMSGMDAREGQYVARGERIGVVGATGNATGPHLHFELRRHDNPVNPEMFF